MGRTTRRVLASLGLILLAGLAGFLGSQVRSALTSKDTSGDPASVRTIPVAIVRTNLSATSTNPGTLGHDDAPWPLIGQLDGIITSEAAIGATIDPGGVLYSVNSQPVYLIVGSTPLWRPIVIGATGPDVQEVKTALGLPADATYTARDSVSARAWQRTHGYPGAGTTVPLGEFVVEPIRVRVAGYKLAVGATIGSGGEALSVTSTQRIVTVAVPLTLATDLHNGDPVTVQAGSVSAAGTVLRFGPADTSGQSTQSLGAQPTATVIIALAAAPVIAAPDGTGVQVTVTTGRANGVLAVPIVALLALAEGGYGLEVVGKDGKTRLVRAQVGLVDGSLNLVQVEGPDLAEGMKVLVPRP